MMVIGITGGMASGKSSIARMMARRGIPHIDADKLVHELFTHDKPTIAEIGAAFTGSVVDGKVDRKALGAAIAGDPAKLHQLELLLHPRVRHAEEQAILRAARQRRRAILLDIPLLYETGAETLCDLVIVADAPLALRRQRALRRGTAPATIDRLIARQMPDHERRLRADVLIPTTLGKAYTRRQVEGLLRRLGLA